jgi:excisionase family DNA binding protein
LKAVKNKSEQEHEQKRQQPIEQRLFDLKDVAAYLGCKVWTVREMVWRGEIAFIRNGKRQFIAREDLDEWITKSKTKFKT